MPLLKCIIKLERVRENRALTSLNVPVLVRFINEPDGSDGKRARIHDLILRLKPWCFMSLNIFPDLFFVVFGRGFWTRFLEIASNLLRRFSRLPLQFLWTFASHLSPASILSPGRLIKREIWFRIISSRLDLLHGRSSVSRDVCKILCHSEKYRRPLFMRGSRVWKIYSQDLLRPRT